MKTLEFIKKNLMMVLVLIAYVILFVFKFDYGVLAVKNSSYYIIEMLQIMPIVFLLTALLDAWVPRETIIKYLGEDSKVKGTIFAFILGSISAGPIYAAFPICVLLLKKGATVKNIVIILSSWAVIKIPMLINEVAFLGVKFMAIRWILTIIAIVVFSHITNMIVKKEDIPIKEESEERDICVDEKACIGCGICKKTCPEAFIIENRKAIVNTEVLADVDKEKLNKAVEVCPMNAIKYN